MENFNAARLKRLIKSGEVKFTGWVAPNVIQTWVQTNGTRYFLNVKSGDATVVWPS